MADKPINLRLRRKQRARDEKRARGDAAAAASGISKADRELAATVTDLQTRRIDAHKLEARKPDDDS